MLKIALNKTKCTSFLYFLHTPTGVADLDLCVDPAALVTITRIRLCLPPLIGIRIFFALIESEPGRI